MTRLAALSVLPLLLAGCGDRPEPGAATPPEPPAGGAADAATSDPEILPRPFTAEQIRAAWVPGLELTLRQRTPEQTTFERWKVVSADEDSVGIETVAVDEQGNPTGSPQMQRATWVELRDHATFPADSSSRSESTRQTPLGELDGWLYTRRDPESGAVTELFFARSLPGAPIHARTTRNGELLVELHQVERTPPD